MKLAIFICARNEQQTIGEVIADNCAAVDGLVQVTETIVVDDGSDDDTVTVATEAGARVVSVKVAGGLANAFRTGVSVALETDCTHLAHTDADGQYAADSLARLCGSARAGADVVVGDRLWRRPPGMSDFRYVWNQRLTDLVSLLAGTPIADAQSGCRIFSRTLAEEVHIGSSFTYTQEQLVRAARLGFPIESVPIDFGPRSSGASRLVKSPLNYLARVLADLDSLAVELELNLEGMKFMEE
ncbi:MAG: glycosyltransferase family 2 protein [Solirubrobacterales bacterium]